MKMKIVDFRLDSVKILDKAVHIEFHTSTDSAKQTYDKNIKERAPHPDFNNSLKVFEQAYMKSFFLKEEDFNVIVKGISENDKDQIQIIGMLEAINGSYCSLNTPFIAKDNEDAEFDADTINTQLEVVRIESWKYIFEGKTSQIEIDFAEDKE